MTAVWVVAGLPVRSSGPGCEQRPGSANPPVPARPHPHLRWARTVSLLIDLVAVGAFILGAMVDRAPEPVWVCVDGYAHCADARDAELAEPEGTRDLSGSASWVARAAAVAQARMRAVTAGPPLRPGHPDTEHEGN